MDGGWTNWGAYDTCTKTCGGGTQTRRRSCTNPAPKNGGKSCQGESKEQKKCRTQQCPGKYMSIINNINN